MQKAKTTQVPVDDLLTVAAHPSALASRTSRPWPKPGSFVESGENDLGPARLIQITGEKARLEYFVSPASGARHEVDVPVASVRPAEFFAETRVYCLDPDRGTWRAGRLLSGETVPGHTVGRSENLYPVGFPNNEKTLIPASRLFVRWRRPVDDPTDWLAATMTETPFWHEARARFMRFAVEQRAAFGGLTALASASIDLHRYQMDVVRRVLHDPVQRYLIADEVGLGKTIEAGVILRQYFLDHPDVAAALVVVPPHLVDQWRDELSTKVHLDPKREASLHIVASTSDAEIARLAGEVDMLIVDEAHQLARAAYSERPEEKRRFEVVRKIAGRAARVLLLSATPLLNNEDGFLAMLHLLDPTLHRLEDRERFRKLVAERQRVADSFQALQDDAAALFLEDTLDTLGDLAASDPRTLRLCEAVRGLIEADEEDAQRVGAIRALRAHIAEIYRLDRRLLRTRRDADDVAAELPRRVGVTLVPDGCQVRAGVGELLESWRRRASFAASTAQDRSAAERSSGRVFVEMLQLSLSHPSSLRAFLARRASALDGGAPPAFDEEREWLAENVVDDPRGEDARIGKLMEVVQTQNVQKDRRRCVIFVDDPAMARDVYTALSLRYPGKVLRAPLRIGSEAGAVAVVCDRTSEEGLNLQGERSIVVHFDLPLSPDRIEQRIGRIDRIGAKSNRISSVALISSSPWESGWAACLQRGARVFERSIAPLQYALDDRLRSMCARLLHDGPSALEDATAAMLDPDTGLDRELQRIRNQEVLDSIERSEEDGASFLERVEASDEAHADMQKCIDDWVIHRLHFERRPESGVRGVFRYVYSAGQGRHERSTLLPASDLIDALRPAIDATRPVAGSRQQTYPMTASRDEAVRSSTRLLRIGNPFIDGLVTLAKADDRGVAWALWRHVPAHTPRGAVDIFFRFDFVVETDTEAAVALVREAGGSIHAVRRRADEALAPHFRTVLVNRDGVPVQDPRLVQLLHGEYQKKTEGWTDVNLRPERWTRLEAPGLLRGWDSRCRLARMAAEDRLRTEVDLEALCAEAATRFERAGVEQMERLASRLARLQPGPAREHGERELAFEQRLRSALAAGIRTPSLRPDAAGAIFVSSDNPFAGEPGE